MSKLFYDTASVPMRHRDFRPSESLSESWTGAYTSLKEKVPSGPIAAIVGNRGTGKTQLAACLIGFVALELDKSASYYKSMEIFLRLREAMTSKIDSEMSALQEFTKPFLLVIDAYEVRSDSDFENRVLDHIIDKRYDAMKATVIISNDSAVAFQKQIGASICDRIAETGGIVELKSDSFRRSQKIGGVV
jgi:DNA replication protein DnaC